MTDARYPEAWLNDRRIVRLSNPAHRLFVTALAWSASNRTDGVLEPEDVDMIHGAEAKFANELLAAGLWEQHGHGWRVKDFNKSQSTKAQLDGLDHRRNMDRERQAKKRAKDRGEPPPEDPSDESLSRDVTGVTEGVTSTVTQRQGKDRQERQAGEEDRSGSGGQPGWVVDGYGVIQGVAAVGAVSAGASTAPLAKCRVCGRGLSSPLDFETGMHAGCETNQVRGIA